MKINPLFEPSQQEIDALVSRYPLALVISAGAAGLSATRMAARPSSGISLARTRS